MQHASRFFVVIVGVLASLTLATGSAQAAPTCKPISLNALELITPASLGSATCLETRESVPSGTQIVANLAYDANPFELPAPPFQIINKGQLVQGDGAVCQPLGFPNPGCIVGAAGRIRLNVEVVGSGTPIGALIGVNVYDACTTISGALLNEKYAIPLSGFTNASMCFDLKAERRTTYVALGQTEVGPGAPTVSYAASAPGGQPARCALGAGMACFTSGPPRTFRVTAVSPLCQGSPAGCAAARAVAFSKAPTSCADTLAATNPGEPAAAQPTGSSRLIVTCRRLTSVSRRDSVTLTSTSSGASRVSIVGSLGGACGPAVTSLAAPTATATCLLRGRGPWDLYTLGEAQVSVQRS